MAVTEVSTFSRVWQVALSGIQYFQTVADIEHIWSSLIQNLQHFCSVRMINKADYENNEQKRWYGLKENLLEKNIFIYNI